MQTAINTLIKSDDSLYKKLCNITECASAREVSVNIAVCDDDKADIDRLKKLISAYALDNDMEISVMEYTSGTGLVEAASHGTRPDIIFMDINMDDMDGLAVAARLREVLGDVPLILVSAFINYALDGYKVRASRFLVKDDLDVTFTECMDDICGEIRRKTKTIMLPCVEGDINMQISEIVLIETARHKCIIHLKKQQYHIYERIDSLEKMFAGLGFLRFHQSYLVNMRYVRNINSYVLTLYDGRELPVPKARYKEVKRQYILFAGKV